MKKKLPDLSRVTSTSPELENILINGQKILFDKKVKLMPVAIEPKSNPDESY